MAENNSMTQGGEESSSMSIPMTLSGMDPKSLIEYLPKLGMKPVNQQKVDLILLREALITNNRLWKIVDENDIGLSTKIEDLELLVKTPKWLISLREMKIPEEEIRILIGAGCREIDDLDLLNDEDLLAEGVSKLIIKKIRKIFSRHSTLGKGCDTITMVTNQFNPDTEAALKGNQLEGGAEKEEHKKERDLDLDHHIPSNYTSQYSSRASSPEHHLDPFDQKYNQFLNMYKSGKLDAILENPDILEENKGLSQVRDTNIEKDGGPSQYLRQQQDLDDGIEPFRPITSSLRDGRGKIKENDTAKSLRDLPDSLPITSVSKHKYWADIKIKTKETDPVKWLKIAKGELELHAFPDEDKKKIIISNCPDNMKIWIHRVQKTHPGISLSKWMEEVYKALKYSFHLCKAEKEYRKMFWNVNDDVVPFFDKFETFYEALYPGRSEADMCSAFRSHIDDDLVTEIDRLKIDENWYEMKRYLFYHQELVQAKKEKRESARKIERPPHRVERFPSKVEKIPQKSFTSSSRKYDEPRSVNYNPTAPNQGNYRSDYRPDYRSNFRQNYPRATNYNSNYNSNYDRNKNPNSNFPWKRSSDPTVKAIEPASTSSSLIVRPSTSETSKNENQRTSRVDDNTLCFTCNKPGHRSLNCPKNQRETNKKKMHDESKIVYQRQVCPCIEILESPKITLKLQNIKCNEVDQKTVLLDTGASMSLIEPHLVKKMGALIYPTAAKPLGIGRDGSMDVLGHTYLAIRIAGKIEGDIIRLVVAPLGSPDEMLLGMDCIFKLNIGIITKQRMIEYQVDDCEPVSDLVCECRPCTAAEIEHLEPSMPFHPVFRFIDGETSNEEIILEENKSEKEAEFLDEELQQYRKSKELLTSIELDDPDELLSMEERFEKKINPELTEEQKKSLLETLLTQQEAFSKTRNDIGCLDPSLCPITIDIGDNALPRCKPYPASYEKRKLFDVVIGEALKNGIIEESNADGGCPALLVPRAYRALPRLVVDYRPLNKLIKRKEYPMPRVDDYVESLKGYKYFALLDLSQGYYQLGLLESEREKTAFVTPDGKYQYTRLPMGLAEAPMYFQKLINKVVEPFKYKGISGYFDDLPVMGKTFDEFLQNLKSLLERLIEFGLKAQIRKSIFGYCELKFLGHIVSGEGLRPNPAKVLALRAMPYPKNVKGLQRFLGLTNFFQRYIPDYAKIASPLYRLVRKDRKFEITPEDCNVIDKLKEILAQATLMVHFDPQRKTALATDASDYAVGGVLMQWYENPDAKPDSKSQEDPKETGNWKPVSYFSKTLTSYQKNYPISEKECLAIIVGLNKFQHYLEGKTFEILTDHCALCSLPKIHFKNSRINRWAILLSQFDYTVKYVKGDVHPADCLSRAPDYWKHRPQKDHEVDFEEDEDALFEERINLHERVYRIFHEETDVINLQRHFIRSVSTNYTIVQGKESLRDSQHEVPWIKEIITILETGLPKRIFKRFDKRYVLIDGILYKKQDSRHTKHRVVLPMQLIDKVFDDIHKSETGGHFGEHKTCNRIIRDYWNPDLTQRVKEMILHCKVCQQTKVSKRRYRRKKGFDIPNYPMEHIQVDYQGPYPVSRRKNRYIVVATDLLSRYKFAKALPDQGAESLVEWLDTIFHESGFPTIVQTDQAMNFQGKKLEEFLAKNNIQHNFSTAYHPQSQGLVERDNQTLKKLIQRYTRITLDWDLELNRLICAMNAAPNRTTNKSPFLLFHGREFRTPTNNELQVQPDKIEIQKELDEARAKLIAEADKRNNDPINQEPLDLQVGDFIMITQLLRSVSRGKKLTPPLKGPYVVFEIHDASLTAVPCFRGCKVTINLDRVQKYHGPLGPLELQTRHEVLQQNFPGSTTQPGAESNGSGVNKRKLRPTQVLQN